MILLPMKVVGFMNGSASLEGEAVLGVLVEVWYFESAMMGVGQLLVDVKV